MKKIRFIVICTGIILSLFMFSSCLSILNGFLMGVCGVESSSSTSSSKNTTPATTGYDYQKSFYDAKGNEKYRVWASDKAITNYDVVEIIDYSSHILRCFVLADKKAVLDLYQIISRMNTATLEEVIRSTKWEYWFTGTNNWIIYRDKGLQ